jgi:hypothetical protein
MPIYSDNIIIKLKQLLDDKRIILIEEKSKYEKDEFLKSYLDKNIFVCDFYVNNIESFSKIIGGYRYENLYNIDHHAPTECMTKEITATCLAIEYINRFGSISQNSVILINHTDCDSVLSSLIIAGVLPADKRFADASIAADHTGQKNMISDLLQALQEKRDLYFSVYNLEKLLCKDKIDKSAEILVQKRLSEYQYAYNLVAQKHYKTIGHVIFIESKINIDSIFFATLLPEADVILVAQATGDNGRIIIKIRKGFAAPKLFCVNKLNLPDGFGGRWNCGSNKRSGGTNLSPMEYINIINREFERLS